MKRTLLFVYLFAFFLCTKTAAQEQTVEVMARPEAGTGTALYPTGRQPLEACRLLKLPVGSIKPQGWLRKYLELQRDGLTGHLGEISAWLDKNNNAWLTNGGDHGWEEVPYWLKGYGDLAYILGDEKMITETKTWIEGVFKSQQPDGYFGPVNLRNGKRELWAQMIMLWCLQSYYEYTGDERVIDLMTRYFHWQLTVADEDFLKDYWENSRGGDNMWSVIWLYNRTGDPALPKLIEKLHRNTANWMQPTSLPNWHNVNIAQGFREPATNYLLSKDSAQLRASYNTHQLIRRTFGQVPGGMFGADENARLGYIDPRQGVETCGMVEQMASDEIMLGITGDPFWADHCEEVAFNTYPAAVMPDFRALRYITAPNHTVSDSKNHHPSIDNSGPFLSMNPFSSRCCQHNHAQGWPYYAEHLVMATADGGLATVLYASSTTRAKVASGTTVTLTQETHYPFEEEISLRLSTPQEVAFPLYLRIPAWADNAQVKLNGKKLRTSDTAGQYIRIERTWTEGDVVTLHLPMTLRMRTWQVNRHSVSVDYGPLTLSLKIKERYVQRDSRETAIGDSRWQAGADAEAWPTTEIYADSPWNYALVLPEKNPLDGLKVTRKPWPADDFPFTPESVPLEVKATGRRIPGWQPDETGMCSVLPMEDSFMEQAESITLIPMGAARLRISAFPRAKE